MTISPDTPEAEGRDLLVKIIFGLIDDPEELNAMPFKLKAVSLHWEYMFARSLFETPVMAEQGKLLNEVAALVDAGRIRSTATEVAGKIVLEGF